MYFVELTVEFISRCRGCGGRVYPARGGNGRRLPYIDPRAPILQVHIASPTTPA